MRDSAAVQLNLAVFLVILVFCLIFWRVEQRARYHNLMSSYRNIDWTYKEKKYLLWLCQLDVNTFETFEVILDKIKNSNEKRADL